MVLRLVSVSVQMVETLHQVPQLAESVPISDDGHHCSALRQGRNPDVEPLPIALRIFQPVTQQR